MIVNNLSFGLLFTLAVSASTAQKINEWPAFHGEFKVSEGGKVPYWAHPVVCGRRLYVRHSDKLFVYDISGK